MRNDRISWNDIPRILFYSILGGVILTYFTCTSCAASMKNYAIVSLFSASIWATMWVGNSLLSDYCNEKVSWTAAPVKRLIIGFFITVVYSTSVVFILLVSWEAIFSFNFGGYNEIILTSLTMTFIISIILHSRAFLINWKLSLVNAEKFKRESVAAQYESLKSQVNPHFLFNSLNALTNLVYEDQDKAAKFIKQLSDVYRYVLDTRDKELVTLEEEMKFLRSYIYLQEIRFGDNLKIQVDLDTTIGHVAPLALQLLVENAIKHNIVSSDDPLLIRIYSSDNYIVVENNLQKKMILGESSSGLGLNNIRNRYSFLSTKEVQILEGEGRFTVKLPLINKEVE